MTTKYRLTAADRITEANDKGDFDAAWQARCDWIEDEDGVWATACGARWQFEAGGPDDNEAHFCMRCGRPLAWSAFAAPLDDDD